MIDKQSDLSYKPSIYIKKIKLHPFDQNDWIRHG